MVALRDALEVAPDTVVRAENTANRPIGPLSLLFCPELAVLSLLTRQMMMIVFHSCESL